MNSKAISELNSIKLELQSIINELEDISLGLKKDFDGIGTERCAQSVDAVISQYKYVKRKLNNMNTTKLTKDFEEALKNI